MDTREQLVYLLTQAAELEHAIPCQDLFALSTLNRDPADRLTAAHHQQVTRWGQTLTEIAVQEMLHLTLATTCGSRSAPPPPPPAQLPHPLPVVSPTCSWRWCRSGRRRCGTSCTRNAPTTST